MSFENILITTLHSLNEKMNELLNEIQINREMIEELQDIIRNENIVVSDYYNDSSSGDDQEDSFGE